LIAAYALNPVRFGAWARAIWLSTQLFGLMLEEPVALSDNQDGNVLLSSAIA
jgi:hypothetical protein